MSIRFSEPEMEILAAAGYTKTYHPGEFIYLEGETADMLYFIREGRVRVMLNTENGQEMTMEILEKGRLFGESSFLSQSVRPTTVTAVTEVVLISCSLQELIPCLCDHRELLIKLLQHCSETMNHLSYMLHSYRFMDRYQKVASFLLTETLQNNPEKGITPDCLPYSHEEIAWCIGLARPTVSHVLKEFENRGWVKCSYGAVQILDQEALRHPNIGIKE